MDRKTVGKRVFRDLALVFLGSAVLGRLSAPDFLGFTVLPLGAALVFALLAGPRQWREAFASLSAPGGRAALRLLLVALFSLALLLVAGDFTFLPSVNVGATKLALAPETLDLLKKLDRPVKVTVNLGAQSNRTALLKELAVNYARASQGQLSFTFLNPQTETAGGPDGPRLVEDNTARVEAEGFGENLAYFSETSLNASLTRLLIPERRLIYFLNTFGEKTVGDNGPNGLSLWAENLSGQRLMATDYYWPEGDPIPPEAAAVVLAGPRAPLGELRETILLNYLKNGGRVLIMVDPLTVAVSPEFWRPFGLEFKDGLVIDPEGNLAGTDETFVLCRDYPAHPLTRSLARPSLWPLAGAFSTFEKGRAELETETYAVAQSSFASWLESDAASLAEGSPRYQPEADLGGPLVLAAASSLKSGGRLLALADSELAVNNFSGFSGNQAFISAAIHWLLDGEAALPPKAEKASELIFSRISAKLAFWLPVLVWPLAILALWALFVRRKRGR